MADLGMIGGVRPDGVSFWQSLDGSGKAHAANPEYSDYSQLFREFTFDQKPGYVPVGERDGRTVYAAPDNLRGEDGNYLNVSAADAQRLAQERGTLIPTRDEYRALAETATRVPMPTFPNGVGDPAAYTRQVSEQIQGSGPVVHGKEFFGSGNVDAVNFWANGKGAQAEQAQSPAGSHPAFDIIRGFEGYRDTPYWDVNALRTGYGSDTVTMADGSIVPVRSGMTIARADAERDLDRRINSEFMPSARNAVGEQVWNTLSPQQQGVLTSLAYNYGAGAWGDSLSNVARAVRSGDQRAAASAISALGSHNSGVNRDRRSEEANLFLGGEFTRNTPKPGKGSYAPGQTSGATYGNVQPGALSGAYAYGPDQQKNALAQFGPYDPRMNALAQWEEDTRIEPMQMPMIDPSSMRVW